jgi:heptaprenylglyceryl phosphate synthase
MKDFFKKISISKSNFSGIGLKSDLSAELLNKILNHYPDISPEWLLTGKEPMLRTEQNKGYHIVEHNEMVAQEPQATYAKKCPICQKNEEIIRSKEESNQLLRDKIAYLEEKLSLYQTTNAVKTSSTITTIATTP